MKLVAPLHQHPTCIYGLSRFYFGDTLSMSMSKYIKVLYSLVGYPDIQQSGSGDQDRCAPQMFLLLCFHCDVILSSIIR